MVWCEIENCEAETTDRSEAREIRMKMNEMRLDGMLDMFVIASLSFGGC